MKLIHPNLSRAAALIAIALLFGGGCANQHNGLAANPFASPSRVPPPSTRALLPGQAQPYYPGDPLPVMQSKAAQPANSVALASHTEPEIPSATEHLSWTSPSQWFDAPAETFNVPASAEPTRSAQPSSSAIAANESTVAIPDDGDSLRFAMPTPQPAEPRPFVPSGSVANVAPQPPITTPQPPQFAPQQQFSQQPQQLMQQPQQFVQQPLQLSAPPSTQNVMQAVYTEPVITTNDVAPVSPWRSPQIASTNVNPPTNTYQRSLAAQAIGQPLTMRAATMPVPGPIMQPAPMPTLAMANTMDVRLRAVPSPPELFPSPTPRIRIPGYESSPPMISSNDGFRPRTSMR